MKLMQVFLKLFYERLKGNNMKTIIFLSLFFSSTAMALFGKSELKLYGQKYSELKGAIKAGQTQKVKEVLENYEIKNWKHFSDLVDVATFKHDPKSPSFYQIVRKKRYCHDQIFKLLIKSGAKIEVRNLKGLLVNNCHNSLSLIISKVTARKWKTVGQSYQVRLDFSEDYQKQVGQTLNPILTSLKNKCKNKKKTACEALSAFKKQLVEYDKQYRHHNFLKTPKGRQWAQKEDICEKYAKAQRYRKLINEERAKGKISGYVNASNLKRWGDLVYKYEKRSSQKKQEYKTRFKQPFNVKSCN